MHEGIDELRTDDAVEVGNSSDNENLVHTKLLKALEKARKKLLDKTLRNKLISSNPTKARARQVRVIDEVSDQVMAILRSGKVMTFLAANHPIEINADDGDSDVYIPVENDEVDERGIATRHSDLKLQTSLTLGGLQKKLLSLFYEGQTIEEEQGVNVLFLALGFLEWREAKTSDISRFAPLILLPVELLRDGAKDRFKLKIREEDLFSNINLQAWLKDQFGLELPDLPDEDDWKPTDYFDAVRKTIAGRAHWQVHDNEILLGFFSFSKFMLWRDLDPENWPTEDGLFENGLLQKLLLRGSNDYETDTPLLSDGETIDDVFKPSELIHIRDADSSQAIAIQEALSGKNLVIQGPPGTGKSQTITNIIAGAVHAGKTVLFVAEKMAALNVVHQRLEKQKIGTVCLELHSRKTSKPNVIGQIKQGMTAPVPPAWSDKAFSELEHTQSRLSGHSRRLNTPLSNGASPYALIGKMSLLKAKNTPTPSFAFPAARDWSMEELEDAARQAGQLGERITLAGIPAGHPWKGAGIATPDMFTQDRLRPVLDSFLNKATAFEALTRTCRSILQGTSSDSLGQLTGWVMALFLIARRPLEVDDLLVSSPLAENADPILVLAGHGERLQLLRQSLSIAVIPQAWERDWTQTRLIVAAQGRSPFRVLSSRYRQAIQTMRGVAIGTLPKKHEERLSQLDNLMEATALAAKIKSAAEKEGRILGTLWKAETTDWTLIKEVLAWIAAARSLEPHFHLRTAACLIDPGRAKELAEDLGTQIHAMQETLKDVEKAFGFEVAITLDGRQWDDLAPAELKHLASQWHASLERLMEWPAIRDGLAWLREIGCDPLAQQGFDGTVPGKDISPVLQLAALEQMWLKMREAHPDIEKTHGDELSQLVSRFRKADVDRIAIASDQVRRAHIDCHPSGSAGAVGILKDEAKKSRRLKPVRKLMLEAGDAIQRFKPVFLMSPLSVAQFLQPGRLKFDMLLIDEASQIRPEDVLGAIARCKQLVVVGDDRQLPPTDFFSRTVNDDDPIDEDEDDGSDVRAASIDDFESILNMCGGFPERMLKWHYRSEHPVLIATSNRNFYKNELMLPPSVLTKNHDGSTGLMFHKVREGGYERGSGKAKNEIEAEEIAQAVVRHARDCPELSLGIGTFSMSQRDAIRNHLEKAEAEHPEVHAFIKRHENTDPVFVKNLENIQGDERDVIFISVGYGRDKDGRLTQNFGPIGREGGERRLNVLITRSKKRCEIFSSIVAEDIKFEGVPKPGVAVFKEFLKLAKDGHTDFAAHTGRGFDSDFEEAVSYAIKALGYDCHPQVGMAGFFIDIGVLDPRNPDRYLLGIECDGAAYHSSRYARDRDRLRQTILESRGWKIHRIWSTDWFYRRDREIQKLKDAIECAIANKPTETKFDAGDAFHGLETLGADLELDFAEPTQKQEEKTLHVHEAKLPLYAITECAVDMKYAAHLHTLPIGPLTQLVGQIIETEKPIHAEEVGRRLASLFGLQRAGSRIQAATWKAIKHLSDNGRCRLDGEFCFPLRGDVKPRDRSALPSAAYVRKPQFIAPAELAAAAHYTLKQNLALERKELISETARLLGFLRTGPDIALAIDDAIETLLYKDLEIDHLGRWRLKDNA